MVPNEFVRFEALLAQHRNALERFVRFRMPKDDADDVLQDTCLTAYEKFSQLRKPEAFKAWLLAIARSRCNDYFRAQAARLELPIEVLNESELQIGRFGLSENVIVRDTLEKLGDKDQQILYLFYWKELPQAEIARQLNIPVGTVKSRLHTAKQNFKKLYPCPPQQSHTSKGEPTMKTMPDYLPNYTITPSSEAPFPVVWEELMGWFLISKEGEHLRWGLYEQPSRKLNESYELSVTGRAEVHGIEGVSITSKQLSQVANPVGDGYDAPENRHSDMHLVAQLTDTHSRILACSRVVDGVRRYYTFLDGDPFLSNWGFGEDNCGNETHLSAKGDILREGDTVTCADKPFLLDVVGRYSVTIGGKTYDTVCVMDVETYDSGVATEQFLDKNGRTILWRRFNRDDWEISRFQKPWTELLPDNERLTINGQTYVHWYDCITDYIL